MIDQTYGHLLPDSEDYLRGLLDDYDVKEASVRGRQPAPCTVTRSPLRTIPQAAASGSPSS
jgi:hypothetical protein